MYKETIKKTFAYGVLFFGSLMALFPFFWMILSSLKTAAEVYTTPPTFLPSRIDLINYVFAFNTAPFGRYFVNSLIVAIGCVALTGFTTILAAFAFSRLRFPGRDLIFALLLAFMMVPFEMLVITNYSTILSLGLHNSIIGLIIPFTASIFYTYILRNAFLYIPESLYNSARVDGASNWLYLWKVMVPMSLPTLTTIMLLNTITSWNAFIWPLLVIDSTNKRTLPFGLYAFMSEGGIRYERLMAGAAIVVLPIIILFLFARRKILTGVAQGGVKG
ncbi:MAG: carbohydrate ABC transporter permease [Treponema sp.]|nr:carbohydrate ABC transporter permease [Treponema sp.]